MEAQLWRPWELGPEGLGDPSQNQSYIPSILHTTSITSFQRRQRRLSWPLWPLFGTGTNTWNHTFKKMATLSPRYPLPKCFALGSETTGTPSSWQEISILTQTSRCVNLISPKRYCHCHPGLLSDPHLQAEAAEAVSSHGPPAPEPWPFSSSKEGRMFAWEHSVCEVLGGYTAHPQCQAFCNQYGNSSRSLDTGPENFYGGLERVRISLHEFAEPECRTSQGYQSHLVRRLY